MARPAFVLHAAAFATIAGVLLAACNSDESAAPTPATCANGVKDVDEQGVDCGGPCTPCADGGACVGTLCEGTPTDGKKNNGETDVDCGGPTAPKCVDGKACVGDTDCANAYCKSDTKLCATPRPDDGTKNGDETDVDCGGSVAPKCGVTKACTKHADCESDACAYNGKCVAHLSCTAHHGGDTCGPADAQGDCCETISVPRPDAAGGAYDLDKYIVTAGRMRAFVERTGGNIRQYIESHRPDGFLPAWDQYLPTTLDDPEDGYTGYGGVYQQLGPWPFISIGGSEPGNRGCNVEGPGARTYRVPDAINDRWEDRQRYSQEDLDEKALVCVTQYMMAAFCAWDGGRLPTVAEISYAYTGGEGRAYPWGASPAPAGFGTIAYDSAQVAPTPPNATRFANHQYNWWSPTERIDNDYSVYIAPPGRFPDGNGKFGHADLAGVLLEWTADTSGDNAKTFSNGSWEVAHPPKNGSETRKALVKYYAIGARCAR